ncbi:hypothetical protein GmRootV59_36630 [Variovorax sp. V59]|uniref:hypothetical protein n=1 Tax=Variovorax TaxID=34072 RepID=UPI0027831A48|nr:hypothetical protein [Variovorax paradoxus]MDP9963565.1 hypothetical protein [Variovorax paradoxus]
MKHFSIACVMALAGAAAHGFEYELVFDQSCSYKTESRSFPCEKTDHPLTVVTKQRGKWFGRNPGSNQRIELGLVREDQYSVILQNPVYFSGVSLLHLMKKTGRFYWTETAYSDVLEADDATVRVGRFKLHTK